MPDQPSVQLNDGRAMPQFGLGVFQTSPDETTAVVRSALQAGYRSIDTAAAYRNERGVGEALKGRPRDETFLTTKLWNDNQGYDEALTAFDKSLERLGTDHVELYLIHWPSPHRDRYVESWRALVRLKAEGRAKSIGVSNFQPSHLERIIGETGVTPAVNQIELHPRFQQRALREVHQRLGIATESWSPLGRGALLDDPTLAEIGRKHGKTAAQVMIRWHLDEGLVVIPKSANPERLRQNIAVFDLALDGEDRARIGAMDAPDGRIGPNPDTAAF